MLGTILENIIISLSILSSAILYLVLVSCMIFFTIKTFKEKYYFYSFLFCTATIYMLTMTICRFIA